MACQWGKLFCICLLQCVSQVTLHCCLELPHNSFVYHLCKRLTMLTCELTTQMCRQSAVGSVMKMRCGRVRHQGRPHWALIPPARDIWVCFLKVLFALVLLVVVVVRRFAPPVFARLGDRAVCSRPDRQRMGSEDWCFWTIATLLNALRIQWHNLGSL